jgi:DNA-binding MarR family transcriptional regulator
MRIEDEIKQERFKNPVQKAVVNLLFTSGWFNGLHQAELKPFKISPQQYNILRILRGSYPNPVTVKSLMERMLDRMSNASRLVEKLVQRGLVKRTICPHDRRAVDVVITGEGLRFLEKIEEKRKLINKINLVLTDQEANQLSDLLDKMRNI